MHTRNPRSFAADGENIAADFFNPLGIFFGTSNFYAYVATRP